MSATAALLVAAALLAAAALAVTSTEQTRESYVAQVEPICKTNTKANERILAGVRKESQGRQAEGRRRPVHAGRGGLRQGREADQGGAAAGADAAKLTKWLGYLEDEQKLLGEIGKALKADNKSQGADRSRCRLTHNGNLANNAVLGFEFNYCLIDSSRFS